MSDELYKLAYLTQYPKINQILQGVIGVFEKVFLGRIRGYYLQGSFGNRSTVINSDLDMYVIFKENFSSSDEAMTALSVSRSCAQISPLLLEIKPGAELDLYRAEHAGIALNFKYSTQFLYGEDIRAQIPTFTSDAWVWWAMKAPQASLRVTRSAKVLIFPLQQPDTQAEFYGYERQSIPSADGVDCQSSKWLVATVGWIATALVAHRTKQYVGSKGEAVQLYKTQINDQWTTMVEQVYEQCRNRWHYLIPEGEADRQILQSLCWHALDFSNHYLTIYRNFVLHKLSEGTSQQQLFATENLAQVIYPDDQEIANALEELQQSNHEKLRKAAYKTEDTIKQILDVK
ncbi:hypothetical protein Lepto7375DRAFT_6895 [Leptolyngbya sp. PCC 7375]|nr:hypothetical protein Lepto7375DRAFT_6895 [Leptolyngbya sp. PCC 7375]